MACNFWSATHQLGRLLFKSSQTPLCLCFDQLSLLPGGFGGRRSPADFFVPNSHLAGGCCNRHRAVPLLMI